MNSTALVHNVIGPTGSSGAAAAVGDGSDPENPLKGQRVADAFKHLLDLPGLDAGIPRRRSSRRRAQGKQSRWDSQGSSRERLK
jgi:hypothetical protein